MSAPGGACMRTAALLAGLPVADPPKAGTAQLVVAALLGIAVVVVLITWLKVHPFLALILGSAVLGIVAALGVSATIDSFTKGVGSTVGSVGLLIALGAMIGALLADSGGGDEIVDTIVQRVGNAALPWAMVAAAALIGLTLLYGIIVAIPTVIISGPLLANIIARYVHATPPVELMPTRRREPVAVGAGAGDASGSLSGA